MMNGLHTQIFGLMQQLAEKECSRCASGAELIDYDSNNYGHETLDGRGTEPCEANDIYRAEFIRQMVKG